jgi:hypothetical protein
MDISWSRRSRTWWGLKYALILGVRTACFVRWKERGTSSQPGSPPKPDLCAGPIGSRTPGESFWPSGRLFSRSAPGSWLNWPKRRERSSEPAGLSSEGVARRIPGRQVHRENIWKRRRNVPTFDGTGPLGRGAGTGRFLGRCRRRAAGVGESSSAGEFPRPARAVSPLIGVGRSAGEAGGVKRQGLRQGLFRLLGKGL